MNKLIAENIERISDHFGLDLRESNKCYLGCCPVHGGDNASALNFYHIMGHTTVGNWRCNTQGCEQEFGKNAIGFIRGVLSARKFNWSPGCKETVSFAETISWLEDFFGIEYNSSSSTRDDITCAINKIYTKRDIGYTLNISNQQYLNSGLVFPDSYFANRGYSQETLSEFGIGYCGNPSKRMYTRAVVPLHNRSGERVIGCLGRSTWDKCDICECYHSPKNMCPAKEKRGIYCKWKNSPQFPSGSELYNYHRAKPLITSTGVAIITEGSPNVWRLHEAGFKMSMGCFGSKFSPEQKNVLDSSGAHTIIIVPDAGSAGQLMIKQIIDMCKHSYNIVTIEPSYDDDIGECNIDTVKTILSPFFEKYREK